MQTKKYRFSKLSNFTKETPNLNINCRALNAAGVRLPALSSEAVTVRPCVVFDATWRAFAALAAEQGVIAESLTLTHFAGGSDRLRRADTLSCHLVT